MKNTKINLKPKQGICMQGDAVIGYLFTDMAGNNHFLNDNDYDIIPLAGGIANDFEHNYIIVIESEAYPIYINDGNIIEWIYDTDFNY